MSPDIPTISSERETFTLSAGGILYFREPHTGRFETPSIVLGTKSSGHITPIAGGVGRGKVVENPFTSSLENELIEELGDAYTDLNPTIERSHPICSVFHTYPNKTAQGKIFHVEIDEPKDKYIFTGNDEIPMLVSMSMDQLATLVHKEIGSMNQNSWDPTRPIVFFKPEFNLPVMIRVLEQAARSNSPYGVDTESLYQSRFGVYTESAVPYSIQVAHRLETLIERF